MAVFEGRGSWRGGRMMLRSFFLGGGKKNCEFCFFVSLNLFSDERIFFVNKESATLRGARLPPKFSLLKCECCFFVSLNLFSGERMLLVNKESATLRARLLRKCLLQERAPRV